MAKINKIPCIECTPELWEYIEPYLRKWGYKCFSIVHFKQFPILALNIDGTIGKCTNINRASVTEYNRELVTDVEEFLERAAELKGFTYKKEKSMKEFTINDIKPGMVVEYRNGERRLAVLIKDNLHFLSNDKVLPNVKEIYNNDLTYRNGESLDIMKVYNVNSIYEMFGLLNNDRYLNLLWERPKEVVITMDEIAKKFGYNVEQIQIKK